jgi:predicted lipid carrier protein YhbT
LARRGVTLPSGSLHLHRSDGDGEWMVTFSATGVDVAREHAKGDVAVRAPASELLLLLWNRRRPDDLGGEVFGDVAVVARWQADAHV